MSCRKRRSRYPVSSKQLKFLDSGQVLRTFRNDVVLFSDSMSLTFSSRNIRRRSLGGQYQDPDIKPPCCDPDRQLRPSLPVITALSKPGGNRCLKWGVRHAGNDWVIGRHRIYLFHKRRLRKRATLTLAKNRVSGNLYRGCAPRDEVNRCRIAWQG